MERWRTTGIVLTPSPSSLRSPALHLNVYRTVLTTFNFRDLKGPRGIAIDDEGYCIVSKSEGNCLSIFDPRGNKIHTVAMPELCRPCGLALDPKDGSVHVASNTVDIVLKFSK